MECQPGSISRQIEKRNAKLEKSAARLGSRFRNGIWRRKIWWRHVWEQRQLGPMGQYINRNIHIYIYICTENIYRAIHTDRSCLWQLPLRAARGRCPEKLAKRYRYYHKRSDPPNSQKIKSFPKSSTYPKTLTSHISDTRSMFFTCFQVFTFLLIFSMFSYF